MNYPKGIKSCFKFFFGGCRCFIQILTASPSFPNYVSIEARSLISLLLDKDPSRRLGSISTNDIKSHIFFWGVDWNDVLQMKIEPPIRPRMCVFLILILMCFFLSFSSLKVLFIT